MKTAFMLVLVMCAETVAQDTDPPYVDGMDPDEGEDDYPPDTDVVFHCKDDLSGVDSDTIDFTMDDDTLSGRFDTLSDMVLSSAFKPSRIIPGDLDIDDSDICDVICTFDPYEPLYGQYYICTVAGELADVDGNEMGEDFIWIIGRYAVDESTWGEVKALEW